MALTPTPDPVLPVSYPIGRAWHVCYVFAKSEFRVRAGLRADGFDVYCPVEKRFVKHARRKEIRERPLFPGYLFVGFDPDRDHGWHSRITSVDGVMEILSHGKVCGLDVEWIPVRVGAETIERIRRKEAAGDFDYTKSTCAFTPGETVRIADGPFAGLDAIVHSTPDNKKVEVLLDLLNRKTVVKLQPSELEKA